MAVIKVKPEEVELLARLMRAEAESDGSLGMLAVGNVGVNRVLADCSDFEDINTITQMVYQSPGGFEAVDYPYFYQKARQKDIDLANRVINGERFVPATNALWFFNPGDEKPCPATWYDQPNTGRYKEHCFFAPYASECPNVY